MIRCGHTPLNPRRVDIRGLSLRAILSGDNRSFGRRQGESCTWKSGKINYRRLNRGSDRQASAVLYRIVVFKLCYEQRTLAYMQRRTEEEMTKAEVI